MNDITRDYGNEIESLNRQAKTLLEEINKLKIKVAKLELKDLGVIIAPTEHAGAYRGMTPKECIEFTKDRNKYFEDKDHE